MLKKTLRRGGKKGKGNNGKRRRQTRRRRVKSGSGMFATFKSTLYRTYTKNDSFFPVFGWAYPTSIKNLSNAYHKKYMFIMFFDAIYKLFMENAFRYDVDLTKNDTPLSQEDEDESDEIKKEMNNFANETKNKIQEFKDLAIIYNKLTNDKYISSGINPNNKSPTVLDDTSICKNTTYNEDYDANNNSTKTDPKSLLGKFCLDKQMLDKCIDVINTSTTVKDKLMNIYREYELKGDVMGFVKDLYNSNKDNKINTFLEKSGQRTTSRSMFKSITQVAYKVGSMAINGGQSYLILKLEQLSEETNNKIKNLEKELKKQENLDKIKEWEELITVVKLAIIYSTSVKETDEPMFVAKLHFNKITQNYTTIFNNLFANEDIGLQKRNQDLLNAKDKRDEYIRTNILTDTKYKSVKGSPYIYDFLNEENKQKADYVFFKTLRESIHREKGYMVKDRASNKVNPLIEKEVMQYTNIKLTGFKDEFKELLRKRDDLKNKEIDESVKEIEENIKVFDTENSEMDELTEKLWGDELKTYMINIIKERIYDDAYNGIKPEPENKVDGVNQVDKENNTVDLNDVTISEVNQEEVPDYKKPHKANVIKYEKMISVYKKYEHLTPNLTDKLTKLKDIMTACMTISPIMFDYINKQLIPKIINKTNSLNPPDNESIKNVKIDISYVDTHIFLFDFVQFMYKILKGENLDNPSVLNNEKDDIQIVDDKDNEKIKTDLLLRKKHFLDMYLSIMNSKLEIYTRFSEVEKETQPQPISKPSESLPQNDNASSPALNEMLQQMIEMKTQQIKEINQKISEMSVSINQKVLQTFTKTLDTEMRVNTYLAFMGYLLERNLDIINAQNVDELEKSRLRIVGEATAMAAAGGVIIASSPFVLLGGIIIGPVVGVLAGLTAVVYESYKLATHKTQYFIHKEYMLKTIVDLYSINIRVNRVNKNAERDGLIAKIEYYETLKSLKNLINTNAKGAIQKLNETRKFFNDLGPYTAIYAYPTTDIYSKGILPSRLTSDKTKLTEKYFGNDNQNQNNLVNLDKNISDTQKTIIQKYLTSYIKDFVEKQKQKLNTNFSDTFDIYTEIVSAMGLTPGVYAYDVLLNSIIEQSKSKSFLVNPFGSKSAPTSASTSASTSDSTSDSTSASTSDPTNLQQLKSNNEATNVEARNPNTTNEDKSPVAPKKSIVSMFGFNPKKNLQEKPAIDQPTKNKSLFGWGGTRKGGSHPKSDKTKTRKRSRGGADWYSTFRAKFVDGFYKAIFDQMKPNIQTGQDIYKQQLDTLARAKVRVGQLLDLCVKRVKEIVPAMIEHHIYNIVKYKAITTLANIPEINEKITEIENYYKSIHKSKLHTNYVDALQIKKTYFGIAKTMISKGFKRLTRSLIRNTILSLKFIYKNGIFGLLMVALTAASWAVLGMTSIEPGTAFLASWGIAQIRNLMFVVAAPFIEMPEMIITRSNEIMSTCKALTPYKNVFSFNKARQYDFLTEVTVNSSKMAEYVNKMYFGLKMKYNLEEVDENELIQNPLKTVIIQCIDLKLLAFDTEEIRIYKKRQIANIRNKPAKVIGQPVVVETETQSNKRIAGEVEKIIGDVKQTALLEKINQYMREYGLTTKNTAITAATIGVTSIEMMGGIIHNIKLLMDIEDDNLKDDELREQIINT